MPLNVSGVSLMCSNINPVLLFRDLLIIDLATALRYAHNQGCIHRDVKPANIFLRGQNGPPVLGDFGLVWIDDSGERLTLTDEAVGSFNYMAPELQDGRVEIPTTA